MQACTACRPMEGRRGGPQRSVFLKERSLPRMLKGVLKSLTGATYIDRVNEVGCVAYQADRSARSSNLGLACWRGEGPPGVPLEGVPDEAEAQRGRV